MKIDFPYKRVLDIKHQCPMVVVLWLLDKLFSLLFELWDASHQAQNILILPYLDEIKGLKLALHNKHAVIVLEIKVIICLKSHLLTYFAAAVHVLCKILPFLNSSLLSRVVKHDFLK